MHWHGLVCSGHAYLLVTPHIFSWLALSSQSDDFGTASCCSSGQVLSVRPSITVPMETFTAFHLGPWSAELGLYQMYCPVTLDETVSSFLKQG